MNMNVQVAPPLQIDITVCECVNDASNNQSVIPIHWFANTSATAKPENKRHLRSVYKRKIIIFHIFISRQIKINNPIYYY